MKTYAPSFLFLNIWVKVSVSRNLNMDTFQSYLQAISLKAAGSAHCCLVMLKKTTSPGIRGRWAEPSCSWGGWSAGSPSKSNDPLEKLMTRAPEQTGSTSESTLASGLIPWLCEAPFSSRLTSSKLCWSSRVGVDGGDRRRQTGQLLHLRNSVCNHHLVAELGYKMLPLAWGYPPSYRNAQA